MDRLTKSFLVLASVGIVDAIYHGYGEVTTYSTGIGNVCNINSVLSCKLVFESGFRNFLGVSLWVYGVVWFPLVLVLGWYFARKSGRLNGVAMLPLLMVGNIFTLYLWYLELGVIHALCPVCISLYALNYLMTGICLLVALKQE